MKRISLILSIALSMTITSFGQLKVAPLNIKERTLANGMRIVSVQDNTSPTV